MLGMKASSLVASERVLLSWLRTTRLEGVNSRRRESWVPAPRSAPPSSRLEPGAGPCCAPAAPLTGRCG